MTSVYINFMTSIFMIDAREIEQQISSLSAQFIPVDEWEWIVLDFYYTIFLISNQYFICSWFGFGWITYTEFLSHVVGSVYLSNNISEYSWFENKELNLFLQYALKVITIKNNSYFMFFRESSIIIQVAETPSTATILLYVNL